MTPAFPPFDEPLFWPFTLSCSACDTGDDVESEAEALKLGWTKIQPYEGGSTSFTGLCPDCRREEAKG